MTNKQNLETTDYAKHKYNLTKPVEFDVAMNYAAALMAIAGADGELAAKEMQWYVEQQKLLFTNPGEYIEALHKIDWKNVDLKKVLGDIHYDFPLNFRRSMLYQAIKMSRADGEYHALEKEAIRKAGELLGIDKNMIVSLESVAEMEDATERLRLSLLETDV